MVVGPGGGQAHRLLALASACRDGPARGGAVGHPRAFRPDGLRDSASETTAEHSACNNILRLRYVRAAEAAPLVGSPRTTVSRGGSVFGRRPVHEASAHRT